MKSRPWTKFFAVVLALLVAVSAQAQQSPVSQTPLSQVGVSLQSGMITADGGLVSNVADVQRGANQAKTLNNLQMSEKRGVWTSRNVGWTKHRASAFNSGAAFKDFGEFVDGSGNRTLLFQAGSKVMSYNVGTQTETDVITGLSTSAVPCMRGYSPSVSTSQPIVVYCNGNAEPIEITSTSASSALEFNAGNFPGTFNSKTYSKPAICEPFSDRMAYAIFNGTDTAFDVLISDQGDAEDFTLSAPVVATDAVAFTIPAALGPLKGMHAFKNGTEQVLIIGCTKGLAAISGTDATTFNLEILTRSHGIVNNRCWVEVDNDLLYLASDGIRSLAATVQNDSLQTSILSYPINDQIKFIDFTNAADAHACNNPLTQEVQWWVPETGDGSQCKHAFIMNYAAGGIRNPIWSTKSGTAVACSTVFNNIFYGGGYTGLLQKHYSGNKYDTTAIDFLYCTPLISLGNPSQHESLRKIVVVTDGEAQKFTIRPFVYARLANGATVRGQGRPVSQVLQAGIAGGTTLGSWILGASPFPAKFVKTLDFNSDGVGLFWEFEIASTATDHSIDFAGLQYILSGGGIRR